MLDRQTSEKKPPGEQTGVVDGGTNEINELAYLFFLFITNEIKACNGSRFNTRQRCLVLPRVSSDSTNMRGKLQA